MLRVGHVMEFSVFQRGRRTIVSDQRCSVLHHAAGSFAVSQFFMSAAMRSCPAFLMASDRFNPGGSFLACARASDARGAHSWISRSLGVSGFMSSSLLRRSQVAVLPAGSIGLQRVGVYLRLVDKPALSAPQGPMLESVTC